MRWSQLILHTRTRTPPVCACSMLSHEKKWQHVHMRSTHACARPFNYLSGPRFACDGRLLPCSRCVAPGSSERYKCPVVLETPLECARVTECTSSAGPSSWLQSHFHKRNLVGCSRVGNLALSVHVAAVHYILRHRMYFLACLNCCAGGTAAFPWRKLRMRRAHRCFAVHQQARFTIAFAVQPWFPHVSKLL